MQLIFRKDPLYPFNYEAVRTTYVERENSKSLVEALFQHQHRHFKILHQGLQKLRTNSAVDNPVIA